MEWRLLRGLDEADRERVLTNARRRTYSRGEVLFHEGDPGDTLHLLAEGRVAARVTTPNGDVATFGVLGPGDAFGEMALLRRTATRTATIVALEPVVTLTLHKDVFESLCRDHPQIDSLLVGVLAQRVERLSSHLVESLYVAADKRVLRRLLEICRLYADEDATSIVVPLTQEDLSGLAGTTRPTVNQVLRKWEDGGVLALARGRIEVLDLPGLRRAAR